MTLRFSLFTNLFDDAHAELFGLPAKVLKAAAHDALEVEALVGFGVLLAPAYREVIDRGDLVAGGGDRFGSAFSRPHSSEELSQAAVAARDRSGGLPEGVGGMAGAFLGSRPEILSGAHARVGREAQPRAEALDVALAELLRDAHPMLARADIHEGRQGCRASRPLGGT